MLKIATSQDFDTVYTMALKFLESIPYKDYYDEDKMKYIVDMLMNSGKENSIIILNENKGMIAGIASDFLFGYVRQATEIAWWVEPEHRKSGVGQELLEAFEYWAKNVAGCKLITMISLDDQLGKFYEKNDYDLHERAYLKEL